MKSSYVQGIDISQFLLHIAVPNALNCLTFNVAVSTMLREMTTHEPNAAPAIMELINVKSKTSRRNHMSLFSNKMTED